MASTIRGSDNFDSDTSQGLGVNQTWQNMLSQRADNTNYTNNTGRPIYVTVSADLVTYSYAYFYLNDQMVQRHQSRDTATSTSGATVSLIVPDGDTYRVDVNTAGGNTIDLWWELR